ncbi:TonB-dependent receptor [Sphingomonas sp. BIUV-7]|uniref:TonB-dependent receptor n=1 Tax=Sphingomonas natans TaxID=3063330 RepID=A0ABT8YCS3_9SPHN|nr:TonB-dependent receptor [Sphingomonas sp. BIUV-7]MDO6415425.1 TonB-dependent receptor [Sphingomonas sp. BIUV-7]
MRFHRRILFVSAAVLALGASGAGAAQAVEHRFDIAAQDLRYSLLAIARDAGLELVAPSDLIDGLKAPPLRGRFTTRQALDILLEKSAIGAEIREGTIYITRRDSASSTAPPGMRSDPEVTLTVTGTRLRGAKLASPVITITRQDIVDAGKGSLTAFISTIPQNFNGGQNSGVGFGVPEANGQNLGSATGLNLRGIGSDATLTLLDGHRLSYNLNNNAIDLSTIPFEAVDRIEIVADGASALYGSDAVAGVANILLRNRFDGVRSSARIGSSTDGGNFAQQYSAIAGSHWSSGQIYGSYEFSRTTAVRVDQRDFVGNRSPGLTLLPYLRHHSGLVKGSQSLGERATLTIEGLYHKRWSDRSYALNAAGDFRVSGQDYHFLSTSFAVSPSLDIDPGAGWALSVVGLYGQDRSRYDGTQYAASSVSSRTIGCYCNKASTAEVAADGPLLRLPAGDVRVAIGAGYRNNDLHAYRSVGAAQNISVSQKAYYAFGEVGVPLVSEDQDLAFLQSLSATAALRYERYPGLDEVVTPKFGLIASPTRDVTLKGSWGRSFKAPTLYQQYNSSNAILLTPATLGGSGFPANGQALYLVGGNPDLKPERATTTSATIALHPASLSKASLEVSYFRIKYRDRVVSPIAFLRQSLSNPIYADLIRLAPSVSAVSAAVSAAQLFSNATGAPYDPTKVVAIVNNNSTNAARQAIDGIDLLGRYAFDLSPSTSATLSANGSYLHSSQKLSALQPETMLASVLFNPPHLRGRGGVVLDHDSLTLSGFVNYTGGVSDRRTTPSVRVGSMTTVDLAARLELNRSPIGGIELSVAVDNVFNRKPDLIATSVGYESPYDSTNYSPLGRLVSLTVAKSW